jgi:TP901 family phage tail tape measure protein
MASKNVAGDIEWRIVAETSGLEKGLASAQKQAKGLSQSFSDMSAKAGKAFAVVGVAGAAAIGGLVSKSQEFSKAMAEVNTLGIKDLGGLGDAVKDVSMEFGLELTDAAKAAYQAISAGAKEAETPELLAKAAMAATAGVTDLTTAIELGTSVSNAFGIELSDVNTIFDQAFTAVKGGVTTFEELSAAVGKVSPLMSAAGLSSAEMFAAIGALTKGGIATSEAVTGLKAAMSNIIKPTTEASKLAETLGIKFDSTALQSMGLAGFLDMVKEATGGNVDQMSQLFGSVEALNSVLALTGNQAEAFNSLLGEMEGSTGQTKEAFDAFIAANPGFAFAQLKATISVLAAELGDRLAPVLISLAQSIMPVLRSVLEWARTNEGLANVIAKVVLGVTGLALILAPILLILPGLVTAFGLFSGAITAAAGFLGITSTAAGVTTAAIATTGTTATVATGGVAAFGAAFVAAAIPIAATVVVLGLAGVAVYKHIQAHRDLRQAMDQQAASEVALGATIERRVQQLERQGVKIDRVALATKSMDEQIAELNLKNIEAKMAAGEYGEVLDEGTGITKDNTGSKKENTGATRDGKKAQEGQTGAAWDGRNANKSLSEMLGVTTEQYKRFADQANKAAEAARNANAAASGGGSFANGGVVGRANGGLIKGYANGGATGISMARVGEYGSEIAAFPNGTRIISHTETVQAIKDGSGGGGGIGTFSPNISININGGSSNNILEHYDKFKAKLFSDMASEMKAARR